MKKWQKQIAQAGPEMMQMVRDELDVWDAPPMLGVFHLKKNSETLCVHPVDVPAFVWNGRHPAEIIVSLSMVFKLQPEMISRLLEFKPNRILGLFLLSEAWALDIDPSELDTTGDELLKEIYEKFHGKIADHPRGVEAKILQTIDSEGVEHTYQLRRGREKIDDLSEAEGRMPDTLRQLMLSIKAAADA